MTDARRATLLIIPPYLNADGSPCDAQTYCPHLGIVSLATMLRARGETADLLDASSFEDVAAAVRGSYAVIGITCFTATREAALKCAQLAKEANPDALVLLGGPHATALAREILARCPFVDAVVAGEGEISLLQIARNPDTYRQVPGVVCRNEEGYPHANPRSVPAALADIPFPDLSLLDLNRYVFATNFLGHKNPRWIHFITGRGCPGQCIFCATPYVWGHDIRHYECNLVIERILQLKDQYAIDGIFFFDDTFNTDRGWVEEFCRQFVDRKINLPWWCIGRVDNVSPEMLGMMRKAGCVAIKYGVECGSDRMLRRIGKRITIQQVRSALAMTKGAGILAGAGFIIGFPGETKADMRATIDLLLELDVDMFSLNVPWIFPGTGLFRTAKAEGKISEEYFFRPISSLVDPGRPQSHPCRRESIPIYHPEPFTETEFLEYSRKLSEEASSFYQVKFERIRTDLREGLL
jgi:anaerobic magnesium-protoporphyrin IX monomethyl ester cyclase